MLFAGDLKPPLILSIALIASCLSTPESPEPEINTAAQASTAGASPEFAALAAAQLETDPAVRAVLMERAVARAKFAVRAAQDVPAGPAIIPWPWPWRTSAVLAAPLRRRTLHDSSARGPRRAEEPAMPPPTPRPSRRAPRAQIGP